MKKNISQHFDCGINDLLDAAADVYASHLNVRLQLDARIKTLTRRTESLVRIARDFRRQASKASFCPLATMIRVNDYYAQLDKANEERAEAVDELDRVTELHEVMLNCDYHLTTHGARDYLPPRALRDYDTLIDAIRKLPY